MRTTIIKAGDNYNNWLVLNRISKTECPVGRLIFLCRCVCGKEKRVDANSLRSGASKSCGCTISGRDWTPEEDEILKEKYLLESMDNIRAILPKRSYYAIILHAQKLNLTRELRENRSGDASKLLLDTPEAYYWAGFIAADGHIGHDKRLKITLSIEDSQHLKRFAKFIESENYIEGTNGAYFNCTVTIQDPKFIGEFAKKFDFNSRKTYNPPDVGWLEGDLFISFLCGFIDGDGCIRNQTGRKDSVICLKGHANWTDNYKFFERRLYLELGDDNFWGKELTHINSCGYVVLNFSDRKVLSFLKKRVLYLNLPILNRKWDKIDLSLSVSRYETAKHIKEEVVALKKQGIPQKEIARRLGISNGRVSTILSGRR